MSSHTKITNSNTCGPPVDQVSRGHGQSVSEERPEEVEALTAEAGLEQARGPECKSSHQRPMVQAHGIRGDVSGHSVDVPFVHQTVRLRRTRDPLHE